MADFNYVEGNSSVADLIKSIATSLTIAIDNKWTLVFPANVTSITDTAIVSTKTSGEETFFIKLNRPENAMTYFTVQMGTKVENGEFVGYTSLPVRCSYYKNNPDLYLGEWLTVKFWLNFNKNFANFIIQGDDAVDLPPLYNNFMTTFLIMGACESYEGSVSDTVGNFFLTAGSDIMPKPVLEKGSNMSFGKFTGNGNSDIIAVGTRTGVPYQRHECKYDSSSPFIRKHWVRESLWTLKHHVSPITITHHTDRERGKLQNILIGDKGGLNHSNELILDKGLPTEQQWKYFDINVPFKFYNNGPNPMYGLFLRKS